jgi:tetratricopeptide (TPR) repeat protein
LERQRRPQKADAVWQMVFATASPRLLEWALLQRARWAEADRPQFALALYERLLRQFPAGQYQVEAQINSAVLHERAGGARAALRICEAALLASPDDARAPELRLRIQRLRQTIASESS